MSLLAITSYFNPFQGKLRRQNYNTFRKHLGVGLLTVEWSREGNFDLCKQDADYLIQVRGGDMLWQKERLLNIGLAKAREMGVRNVAFLDCDIVFSDPDWFRHVNAALEIFPIVHCFKHVHHLPRVDYSTMSRADLAMLQPDITLNSLAYGVSQTGNLCRKTKITNSTGELTDLTGNPGMAVACNLEELSPWQHYEGNLVGGGDLVLMAAVTNRLEKLFSVRRYTPAHQMHIRTWREKNIRSNLKLGYVDNQLMHLWHGELENRKYRDRYKILRECDYNPISDLDSEQNSPLRLAPGSNKLRRCIADYLVSRRDC